ncbi:type II toxin-antitoxin system RelE/ParE family toxin [Candidatus Poribacteria bacterium]|nr:type II toxin-antitoxin system RelE/ParE family toxin [Candidatus Poribacteria bacterium]
MWKVEFLNQSVVAEFKALPKEMQANYLHVIGMIERNGPQAVGMPFIKPLGNKLWEIRFKGKSGIARAIYVTTKRKRLVVVHIFIKKTQKTPKRAIDLALKRVKEARL